MSRLHWEELRRWRPFSIDALGLVTLLGADEVDQALGTLSKRRFTEYLPFLAAFVIAGDKFNREEAGYALYNITDGITTTELKGWFTRWLSAQKTLNSTTIFRWKVSEKPRGIGITDVLAPLLALLAVAPLCVITVWIEDWCGVVNSAAIMLSILVRCFVLWQRRRAIDMAAVPPPPQEHSVLPQHSKEKPVLSHTDSITQLHRPQTLPAPNDYAKMLVTRADGKLVTIYAPMSIRETFTKDVALPFPVAYRVARYIGWLAFGTQMCILGMCSLFAQLYTVVLLVLSTWLMGLSLRIDTGTTRERGKGVDGTDSTFFKTYFGSKLEIEQEDPREGETGEGGVDRRMFAFVRLQPNEKQERMLKHWSILPFDGEPWYESYHKEMKLYAEQVSKVQRNSLSGQSSGLKQSAMSSQESLSKPSEINSPLVNVHTLETPLTP